MSNSSNLTISNQPANKYSVNVTMVFLSVQCMTLLLQLAVQYAIHKARLRDNQYQLIRLMSIIEILYVLTTMTITIDALRIHGQGEQNKQFLTFMTFLTYLWNTLSMISNTLISIDRWVAVKYCLRYQVLVTRKKLVTAFLSPAFVNATVLWCAFYLGHVTNKILGNSMAFTNRTVIAYSASIRTLACAIMLILGKKTIHCRQENEQRLQNLTNLHGTQAEELDKLAVLKRGIKDVFKVNFWTCIFLLPIITISFFVASETVTSRGIIFINLILINLCVTANPIIYSSCYGKIRNFWARSFRRQQRVQDAQQENNP